MEITINEKWRLEGDTFNVTLLTRVTPKEETDEVRWGTPRYYPNLETALSHLIDMDISDSETTSFQFVIDHINKLKKEILECTEKMKSEQRSLSTKMSGTSSKLKLRKKTQPSKLLSEGSSDKK